MSILKSGKYFIINKQTGAKVGMSPLNPSYNRYAIMSAPKDIHGPQLDSVTWTVVHVGAHLYELLVERDRVAVSEDGKVFGHIGAEQQWTITERGGMGGYTIEETHHLGAGWVIDGDDLQVKSRYLIVAPSLPPFFPSGQIWEFERIDQ